MYIRNSLSCRMRGCKRNVIQTLAFDQTCTTTVPKRTGNTDGLNRQENRLPSSLLFVFVFTACELDSLFRGVGGHAFAGTGDPHCDKGRSTSISILQ